MAMISGKVIDKLLSLARIEVSDSEKQSLLSDIERILAYVGEIEKVAPGDISSKSGKLTQMPDSDGLRNVMREDGSPHETGIYTEKLLSAAPLREGNYISVKKIL